MNLYHPDHKPEHEIIHELLFRRIRFFFQHNPNLQIIAKWKSDLADWETKYPELKSKTYPVTPYKG